MIEYIYRGFKISYKIEREKQEEDLYTATGQVTYLLSVPKSFTPANFHTEYDNFAGAEHEIRTLLENYINFELKNFYDRKEEVTLL